MSTGRRERKKQEVRQRIIDVAESSIARRGLSRTTVDEIAELADISQATFFNYFPSKADLIDALVERLVDQFNEIVDLAHGTDSSIVHKIDALFAISADLPESQHRLVRDLIVETVRSSQRGPERALTRMRDLFTADIAAAQERGEVRRDQSADALSDAVLGLYVSVMLFWSTDADYPVAERLRTSATLALDLIRPTRTGAQPPIG